MMKVYGIPNCNTIKKALGWLKQNKLPHEFHDYKKEGITKEKLKEWCDQLGWETVLNKKGTTWKTLSEEEKSAVKNQRAAIKLMVEKPSMIKRPVIENDGALLIGFDEDEYKAALKKR